MMIDLRTTVSFCITLLCVTTLGVCVELCSPNDALRLVGFNSTQVGVVQVCKEGHWGTVCTGSSWGKRTSQVICRQLGFPDAIGLSVVERLDIVPASTPIHFSSAQCTGVEERLSDCSVQVSNVMCSHSDDALVICKQSLAEGAVRLVGEGPPNEGIVELYSRQYGWSTICTTDWDDSDARVACMQLGYMGGRSTTSRSTPRQGVLPTKRYSNFQCSGSETSLLDCGFIGPFPYRCFTTSYAGVQCQESVVDGSIPLNVSVLVLVTGTAFCLIALFSITLKCVVGRFRKKKIETENSPRVQVSHDLCRIPRITLDSDAWSTRQISTVTPLAPPSYDDTILADRNVQALALPQQPSQDIPGVLPTTAESVAAAGDSGANDSIASLGEGANPNSTNASHFITPVTTDELQRVNSSDENTQVNHSAQGQSEMSVNREFEGNETQTSTRSSPSDTTGSLELTTTHARTTTESQSVEMACSEHFVEVEES